MEERSVRQSDQHDPALRSNLKNSQYDQITQSHWLLKTSKVDHVEYWSTVYTVIFMCWTNRVWCVKLVKSCFNHYFHLLLYFEISCSFVFFPGGSTFPPRNNHHTISIHERMQNNVVAQSCTLVYCFPRQRAVLTWAFLCRMTMQKGTEAAGWVHICDSINIFPGLAKGGTGPAGKVQLQERLWSDGVAEFWGINFVTRVLTGEG